LVDGMKARIISLVQIDDKGHVILFTSTRCKIKEDYTRKFIAKGSRNEQKLNVLKKIQEEIQSRIPSLQIQSRG